VNHKRGVTIKGSSRNLFGKIVEAGYESDSEIQAITKGQTKLKHFQTQIKKHTYSEDALYQESDVQLLINKQIQGRNGERRALENVSAIISDREQALWMFNTNLNWRLDFLGRAILSQKKKMWINRQIRIVKAQTKFTKEKLLVVIQNYSVKKNEADKTLKLRTKTEEDLTDIVRKWAAFQDGIRKTITKMQMELNVINKELVEVTRVHEQMQAKFEYNRELGKRWAAYCARLYSHLDQITAILIKMKAKLKNMAAQEVDLKNKLRTVEGLIVTK